MCDNEFLIKTENLSFTYDDDDEDVKVGTKIPAVSDVSLSVKRGDYIAILGHNGSGKSTFAKLLNLILIPSSGRIFIDGKDVSSSELTDDEIYDVRKKIGMVFQNPDNQLVATVVEEDVAFGPENLGLPREEIRRRVDDAIALVGMQEYIKHAPHKLSGGQKQRVAIAGVVAMRPECIIFDEATAMLDPSGRHDVLNIMEKLNKDEGIAIINITHYMEEATKADRVIVIDDGKVILDGTPREVFANIELLHGVGLEAPQCTELLYELNKSGLDISLDALTPEECADIIFNHLK